MTAKRPCLDCHTPSSRARCPACERAHDAKRGTRTHRGYGTAWQKHSETMRAEWVATNGWVCPGFRRAAHPATDLVVDHDIGVLCRSCNAHKANTTDRRR